MCCVQVEHNRQKKEVEILHGEREREQQEEKIRNLEEELNETQAEIHTLQVRYLQILLHLEMDHHLVWSTSKMSS